MNTIIWAENQSFTSTQDGDMVHKIIAGNLVVKSGITVTVANRCKGLHIQVMGNCYLYGTITMTARGCYAVGQNVGIEAYADRNAITLDGANYTSLPTCRKIPAAGGSGGGGAGVAGTKDVTGYASGGAGTAGTNGATGGGGGGGAYDSEMNGTSYAYGGAGAAGTSFSGGSGGGGAMNSLGGDGSAAYGGAGAANGGAGGNGAMATDLSIGGGGAGNPPGANVKSADLVYTSVPAGNTGGLLILTVMGYLYIASGAVVSSNGGNGGYWYTYGENGYFAYGTGGASGGGSVNILCATYTNNGTLQANGGTGGQGYVATTGETWSGGAGGAGSVRLNSLRTT